MIIEVDTHSPTPPYEQIRSQLATMIAAGTLAAGTHLPSIRQLAADLGLAANTVARSYRELELEGLVSSRVRHGTVVAERGASLNRAEIRRRLHEAAGAFAAEARRLGADPDEATAAVRDALSHAAHTA